MNAKTLELRNLLGIAAAGIKCCGICGKPESRAGKDVKALPHHAVAVAEDLPAKFRMLSKALGSNLMDFATGERFNAQLESIRAKLTAAREEHDAYTPAEKLSDKAALVRTLTEVLGMIGTRVEGEHSPLALADKLAAEMRILMEVKAEVVALEVATK